ncbi:MAG: hypothetical protein K8H88_30785 [Sandaracinaceae bacterium]|nr:hypothetical protein [Sandaracinaceae bacterium]
MGTRDDEQDDFLADLGDEMLEQGEHLAEAEDELGEHADELDEHQDRLEELDERLNTVFPYPDTPAGAAQRIRLAVPTPDSVLTIGARGSATSEGRAIGPGGFALRTAQNLGAQILGSTIVDTDGLTIVHAGQAMRLVTQADLGIAASQALRAGTDSGNVEITAGEVRANDPAFTVVPDMDVPAAPVVDTATPRQATESEKTAAGFIWDQLDAASGIRTWQSVLGARALTSGVARGTRFATVGRVVDLVRSALAVLDGVHSAAVAAASAFDLPGVDTHDSGAPQVKVHGAGGIVMTSPEAITGYAGSKISFTSRMSASIKAAMKLSLKSAFYAGLYGGAVVSVSSEGPAGLKSYGSCASVSGVFAEVTAKQTLGLRSEGRATLSAKSAAVVEAPAVAIAADGLGAWAKQTMELTTDGNLSLGAEKEVKIAIGTEESGILKLTPGNAELAADRSVRVELTPDGITLKPGGAVNVELRRGETRIGSAVRFSSSGTVVRGNVDLG